MCLSSLLLNYQQDSFTSVYSDTKLSTFSLQFREFSLNIVTFK